MDDSGRKGDELDRGVPVSDPRELFLALLREPVETLLSGGAVRSELLSLIGLEISERQLLRVTLGCDRNRERDLERVEQRDRAGLLVLLPAAESPFEAVLSLLGARRSRRTGCC